MAGLLTVIYFLASLFFNFALLILWTRIALRYFRISPLHPVSKLINSFIDPIIKPIENLIAKTNSPPQRYDLACLALLVIIEILKFLVYGLLLYRAILPISYLILFVLTDLIVQPCNFLFYIILIRVVMSWVNPNWQNPFVDVMRTITDPLLELGHRLVPNISGFDFSPFIVMITLKIITLFMSASMPLRLI